MSIITLPFVDCSGYLAFRMSGFRGLVVPERVVRRSVDSVLCEGRPGTGSLNGRTIGVDGTYHETLAECEAARRRVGWRTWAIRSRIIRRRANSGVGIRHLPTSGDGMLTLFLIAIALQWACDLQPYRPSPGTAAGEWWACPDLLARLGHYGLVPLAVPWLIVAINSK